MFLCGSQFQKSISVGVLWAQFLQLKYRKSDCRPRRPSTFLFPQHFYNVFFFRDEKRKTLDDVEEWPILPGTWSGRQAMDNDNDDEHSFSQLSVHKALTCPEGKWTVADPWLATRNSLPAEN